MHVQLCNALHDVTIFLSLAALTCTCSTCKQRSRSQGGRCSSDQRQRDAIQQLLQLCDRCRHWGAGSRLLWLRATAPAAAVAATATHGQQLFSSSAAAAGDTVLAPFQRLDVHRLPMQLPWVAAKLASRGLACHETQIRLLCDQQHIKSGCSF